MDSKEDEIWNHQLPNDLPPPPPYSEEPSQAASYSQEHDSHSASQTFFVDFTSWKLRHLNVTLGDRDGPLVYKADLTNRKPHMKFQIGQGETSFATVVFRAWKPLIEINIKGQDIVLQRKTRRIREGIYESPNLGTTLTWQNPNTRKLFDFDCTSRNGALLARFTANQTWSMTKAGRLEIFGEKAANGEILDELVVTGLAVAYWALCEHIAIN
ncbi:hypothetical protein ASPWEDRAFT_30608 [Aspergillus wentii DTO 134E9]|uniref:Tubby C-terminal domain-containing protein n=1 Tax=Aspergillus wentii DTO 134E9 TaxID=1073089 RepID=A0A1L9RF31_ASPWE|nr:uncharacterized protein ASPWEDRAFT_30608 [Aspergillus wentii DTO 134E9]KAI9926215.1 hypothetical protein MW887_004678 [Aspergillus wentii]OJJ33541.1 hypothetical protein ASPWEDRAFT_30608 [Aspergillus wentii DTO 134E9]